MSSREEILEILRDSGDNYVSGEELSRRLSLSRTAVWKHIRTLRTLGYRIAASPRLGYRLLSVPDLLLPSELDCKLKARTLGKRVYYFPRIASTNDELKRIADREPEGTIVVAEIQQAGRGRMSRSWHSPFGGLWFSLLLRPRISADQAPKLTLVAAVALAKTIREFTGLEALIKWPNDILVRGKKVAGILTEMTAETDWVSHLIVGIGVNLNVDPEGFPGSIKKQASSLKAEYGSPIARVDFLSRLLRLLEDEYRVFSRGEFKKLLAEWRELDAARGKKVKVTGTEEVIEGVAQGVDDEGNLLVKVGKSVKQVRSGTVSFV